MMFKGYKFNISINKYLLTNQYNAKRLFLTVQIIKYLYVFILNFIHFSAGYR